MKIAIASMGDPRSVKTWSGIPAHIIKSFEKRGYKIDTITLSPPAEPWHYAWQRRIHSRLDSEWFMAQVQTGWLKKVAKSLDHEVAQRKPDIVIVIHGDYLAYTTFTTPSCFIHDTTFVDLVGYYDDFSNLTTRSVKSGNAMYKLALNRADAAIFSSQWASKSAISHYGAEESKVYTIPLGANLNKEPNESQVERWVKSRSNADCCNFLFLGIDWKRKGGPDALKFVVALNKLGINSKLLVAGCTPVVPAELKPFVEEFGFLRKDNPSEAAILESLFIKANALLLLSLAECYGCVYCEANAYGLPALGRDTGGVSEIIKDHLNGLLLRQDETPEELAIRWASIWLNKSFYLEICRNARNEFNTRLNYETFTKRVEDVIVNVFSEKQKID